MPRIYVSKLTAGSLGVTRLTDRTKLTVRQNNMSDQIIMLAELTRQTRSTCRVNITYTHTSSEIKHDTGYSCPSPLFCQHCIGDYTVYCTECPNLFNNINTLYNRLFSYLLWAYSNVNHKLCLSIPVL